MSTKPMRLLYLGALAIIAFGANMTVKPPAANAVVYCAAGVYRAGCVARCTYRSRYSPAYRPTNDTASLPAILTTDVPNESPCMAQRVPT
jgi:hypothetical protein